MGSIIVRGTKLYAKIKAVDGTWKRCATCHNDTPEGRRAVEAWIARTERKIDAERATLASGGAPAPMTVRRNAGVWIGERQQLDLDMARSQPYTVDTCAQI